MLKENTTTKDWLDSIPSSLALIIYSSGVDYSRRFQHGHNFTLDSDDVMLMRDNDSLIIAFPSGI